MALDGWRLPRMGRARARVERGDVRHRHPARPQGDVRLRAGRRADESLRTRSPLTFAPNRWPSRPAGFRAAAEAWWRAGRQLADELLDLCSLALALPQPTLRDRCRATTAQVSLNWYGPRGASDPEPNQFRVGPHTDFGTLTVLDREPGARRTPGARTRTGDWIDAPYVAAAWSSTPAT